jgi:RimJ/RimL family protein N-acetyltransferase
MNEPVVISLIPLSYEYHVAALTAVYQAVPNYWALYHLPGAPPGQAENDLRLAASTPGRQLMGIVRRLDNDEPDSSAEMVGMVDFRQHWLGAHVVSVGMFMVIEALQRQGIGRQAWSLLEPWLFQTAKMHKARAGVEQFNPIALQFFTSLGFQLTGQTNRHRVGDKFVRLLYLEKEW